MNGQSAIAFSGTRRLHIALAVTDLESSRAFYETLLGVPPAKQRPGYVKFEPDDPSVNLTLNESAASRGTGAPVSHFGVQVKSASAVQEAAARLARAGLATLFEEHATCCYAIQDKVWVADPDGNPWEVFVVTQADADQRESDTSLCCAAGATQTPAGTCC